MPFPRSLGRLTDHQVRRWHVDAQRVQARPRRPCVVLSRLPGSGASELGQLVAEHLGYAFFDIEIVDRIARNAGIQRELVSNVDERVLSATESLIDGLRNRHTPFSEGAYVSRLVRVIATLGEGGGAVIVGRGSPYILGPELALRVLVVAPRQERIERIAKRDNLTAAEAEARLAREDADRRAFLKRLFRVDPDDASLYDLAVNTASFDVGGCAALIEEVLARRWPAR